MYEGENQAGQGVCAPTSTKPNKPAAEDIYKEIAEAKARLAHAYSHMQDIRAKLVGHPSQDKKESVDRPQAPSHFEEWRNSLRDMRETLEDIINIQEFLKNCL